MLKKPDSQPLDKANLDQEAGRTRMAFTVSLVTFVLMLLGLAISISDYSTVRTMPEAIAIAGSVALAALVSMWMSRRGRARQGILILVAVVLLAPLPFISTVVPGKSITLFLSSIIIITGVVISTLPRTEAVLAIGLAFVQGIGLILYDYYGPRTDTEQFSWLSISLLLLLALVYGYLNRRTILASGLRARMVGAFLAVALFPLILMSTMNGLRLTNLANEQADQELTTITSATVQDLDTFVQTQLDMLRTEARLPGLAEFIREPAANSDDAISILRSLLLKDPVFITSYAILDRSGKNLLDTNPANVGKLEGDRQYFGTPISSGRPYVSNVMFYEGLPRLYFSSPIRDASGETVGLLRVEYNASILQWIVGSDTNRTQSSTFVVLVDDENYLRLAHSAQPWAVYRTYANLSQSQVENLQKLSRLPAGTAEQITTNQPAVVEGLRNIVNQPFFEASAVALSGEQSYSTAKHLEKAPWLVMSRKSTVSIQEAVAEQNRSAVLLGLISVALVSLAALWITQILAAPIVRLTHVAEQVASGNLDARSKETTHDEIGTLAKTFNAMTGQLKDTLDGLEQRVADRTRALELSSDVSRRLSTILEPDKLVAEVVDLLQFAFGYYHVHIYLYDQTRENLVMAGGTGEAGKTMLERNHSIPGTLGLVGQACETGTPVMVQDTRSDPNWLPNPLLPETRSELAVPILLGEEVLGALDVQQNVVNGLGQQDADLLRSITNQLAIALRNARQYDRAQREAQREALTGAIIEQIQKTQTVEEALQVTVRELGRALNTPRTGARIQVGSNGNGHDDHPQAG